MLYQTTNKFVEVRRAKAIAAMAEPNVALTMSIANFKIEDLEPTAESIEDEKRVIRGELSGDALRQKWVAELPSRTNK